MLQVEQLFASALCAEEEAKEKQFQEQLAAMADEEARMRTSSEPSVSVHELRQQQKGQQVPVPLYEALHVAYFLLPQTMLCGGRRQRWCVGLGMT